VSAFYAPFHSRDRRRSLAQSATSFNARSTVSRFFLQPSASPLPPREGLGSRVAARRLHARTRSKRLARWMPALAANATAKRIKMIRRARRGDEGSISPKYGSRWMCIGCTALRQDDDIRLCDIRDTRAGSRSKKMALRCGSDDKP